jgi:hypothetical protein
MMDKSRRTERLSGLFVRARARWNYAASGSEDSVPAAIDGSHARV